MTFADLVNDVDKAVAPLLAALDAVGPQWMSGPHDTISFFERDNSPLGFKIITAARADKTTIALSTPTTPAPVATGLSPAPASVLTATVQT